MSEIQVIRRNNTRTDLDITRIRDVVEWACDGLDVNPIALESGLTTRLRNGITTREIQENLIDCAKSMCDLDESDWRYVAGRLHIWSLWKDTEVSRGYGYTENRIGAIDYQKSTYPKLVRSNIEIGRYDSRLGVYSDEELAEAGTWIEPDLDRDYDYAGAVLFTGRYLLKDELPQEAYLSIALLLASVEMLSRDRMYYAERFYRAIARRQISLATPILANLRVPNGSLTSCFIVSMEDDLEGIFAEITNTARISKNGGGVGVNTSRIRATGAPVMGKDNASGGVIPWIKLLNDTAIAVNQGGKRAGAVTVGVDTWHLDVPEFLEMQTENGDQRRKAYDVFPQLVASDEFMRRVDDRRDWTLVDPHEVRTKLNIELAELWGDRFESAYRQVEAAIDRGEITRYKRVNARALFKKILETTVETGMPYLWFKDTVNRLNPNKHDGYVPQGNLCQESFSNVTPNQTAHCCNLVSLNLANLGLQDIPEASKLAVRMLDNTIDLTHPPIAEAKAHNDKYRTIGVGAMGLADHLAVRGWTYDNLYEISELFEAIAFWCTRSSMELAIERGAYPAFEGSEWSKGLVLGGRDGDWIDKHSIDPQRWHDLARQIWRHGIRNSHITAIAPNTSSALLQGATASVLPVFGWFFYDKGTKGAVPVAPPFIKKARWFYQENKHLDQKKVVRAIAAIQEWIDTGISMELLFNLNEGVYWPDEPNRSITAKDIYDTIMLAWKLGCKAIYYVRTVQKDNFKESESCVSCAN